MRLGVTSRSCAMALPASDSHPIWEKGACPAVLEVESALHPGAEKRRQESNVDANIDADAIPVIHGRSDNIAGRRTGRTPGKHISAVVVASAVPVIIIHIDIAVLNTRHWGRVFHPVENAAAIPVGIWGCETR